MQLPDDRYVHGRVIRADIPDDEGPMPRTNLIYIYRDPQPTKSPALKSLSVDRLLGPPRFINRLPWSRGYFETVLNIPMTRDDLLEQHCFSALRSDTPYVDEKGRPLATRFEPCGKWALAGYVTIDEVLARAFGFSDGMV